MNDSPRRQFVVFPVKRPYFFYWVAGMALPWPRRHLIRIHRSQTSSPPQLRLKYCHVSRETGLPKNAFIMCRRMRPAPWPLGVPPGEIDHGQPLW